MEPSFASQALGFVAFTALALTLLVPCAIVRHRIARRVPVKPTGPRRCTTTCSAPLCAEPATLGVSVGHDYWPLCVGHGLPLLTEGLRS